MDSGTTLLRLPQKVFDAVVEAVVRTSLVSSQHPASSRAGPQAGRRGLGFRLPPSEDVEGRSVLFFTVIYIKFTVLFLNVD